MSDAPLRTEGVCPDTRTRPGGSAHSTSAAQGETRVTTLELFFDLAFVFNFTQLARLLSRDMTPRGIVQVLLIFWLLWWMYGGYAWLTNHLPPHRKRHRLLLLLGMASFLVLGLATPNAFQGDGVAFGVGYLLIVTVHSALFAFGGHRAARNMLRIAPFHLVAAGLIIVAGIVDGPVVYALWAGAVVLEIVAPMVTGVSGFELRPGHFVERHGLLMIIALGDAFLALGIGTDGERAGLSVVTTAVLIFVIPACLWWVYFDESEKARRAELALERKDAHERSRLALSAFFYAHVPMLLGLILIAAAVKKTIVHPFEPLAVAPAAALAGGVSLYLVGIAWFHGILKIGPQRFHFAASLLGIAAIPVGHLASSVAEVVLLGLLIVSALFSEHRWSRQIDRLAPHLRSTDAPTHTRITTPPEVTRS
ncbi:low temperature requirement protein A [Streptomyces phyllanthi]|uniref:Low temperature requirement protein A n=1 Tax=Streptomyces phyllanthi TaxID=1803180 RepID=A0A5N8WAD7_9ACTN|nr:low temperature requirement protein A [Streptomyces phyllanthi]MPY43756.1 low temperature requirement protein A [Streptomyces phyllanthi]